ncbi:hypothetical protein ENTCAN_06213 [Enterobacter cancerogenus ATCC 35316]|nr:hypothetical protein ENTCAN_06213 [Enterobacter cancerogenus ATCC 35316]
MGIARWRCAYRAYKTVNRRPGKAKPPPGFFNYLDVSSTSGRSCWSSS